MVKTVNDYGEMDDGEEGGGGMLPHVGAILAARRWWIIIPTVLGAIGALAAILLIPPVYRSSAVMLVQSPQLSDAILGEGGNEVVDRRIARIKEQATSRPDLVSLMERHGLYASLRENKPLSDIIETMRSAIALQPSSVDTTASRPEDRTIAFVLSFEYEDPAAAQAVTQDLMQRILELDAAGNSQQASNRVNFLSQQAKDLEQRMSAIQAQISGVTARNGTILNRGGVTMLGGNAGSYDVQIAALQRDNASLINQKDLVKTSDERDPIVAGAENQLAAARAVYSENHPDVISARQRLEEARQLAKSNVKKVPVDTLDQQIAFNNSQIEMLRAARAQEMSQVAAGLSAQAQAPLVQQQLDELRQQLSGVNEQYQEVSSKLFSARAGVRAEDEQMGERLAVVEPPVVPDKPSWPNRLIIAAGGIGGGLALGLLLALAVEFLLRPIRDPDALAAIIGQPTLAVVPVIAAKRMPEKPGKGVFSRWFGPRARRN